LYMRAALRATPLVLECMIDTHTHPYTIQYTHVRDSGSRVPHPIRLQTESEKASATQYTARPSEIRAPKRAALGPGSVRVPRAARSRGTSSTLSSKGGVAQFLRGASLEGLSARSAGSTPHATVSHLERPMRTHPVSASVIAPQSTM